MNIKYLHQKITFWHSICVIYPIIERILHENGKLHLKQQKGKMES